MMSFDTLISLMGYIVSVGETMAFCKTSRWGLIKCPILPANIQRGTDTVTEKNIYSKFTVV